MITLVEPSSSIDMIGPYLSSKVTRPYCQHLNVLAHIEGLSSPVKAVDICSHLTAHIVNDGNSVFEFKIVRENAEC